LGDLKTAKKGAGIDRFALDPLDGEVFEQGVETGDGAGAPAGARLRGVGLDEERRVLVEVPEDLIPDPEGRGSPEEAGVQSTLVARSVIGTPAMSWVRSSPVNEVGDVGRGAA
jgi:hypothetical protein